MIFLVSAVGVGVSDLGTVLSGSLGGSKGSVGDDFSSRIVGLDG